MNRRGDPADTGYPRDHRIGRQMRGRSGAAANDNMQREIDALKSVAPQ